MRYNKFDKDAYDTWKTTPPEDDESEFAELERIEELERRIEELELRDQPERDRQEAYEDRLDMYRREY